MARREYILTDKQFDKIIQINKEGGDPVMYASGGIPLGKSLSEKINDYWKQLGDDLGFDWKTVRPITNRKFDAYPK